MALMFVWTFIACWYLIWGLLVVPWRLLRRGQRRRKYDDRRIAALEQRSQPPGSWSAKPQQKPTPWR